MPFEADVTVRAPVYDTERRGRVMEAIAHLFPDGEHRAVRDRDHLRYGEEVVVDARDLGTFRDHVERQEIGPTVRQALQEGTTGDTIAVRLKKQAAMVDRLTIAVGGHELGAIDLRIAAEDPEALIPRIAPGPAGGDGERGGRDGRGERRDG